MRDRGVFDLLAREVLPELAKGGRTLRAWSAGCGAGEEPYTLSLIGELSLKRASPTRRSRLSQRMRIRARSSAPAARAIRQEP
jgi:chemotaxis protein methyltransferase CheR